MPADILGSEVLEEDETGKRRFRFIRGPVFAQLLMADEINRASPRTQSALLQAMQERHVTVAGMRYDLPHPFHVLATQNPLEQEGTYPLPEAQLDRFLLQINIGYPDLEAEKRVLDAILAIVRSARPEEGGAEDIRAHVAWGPGPRASQAFSLAVRARALVEGRFAPSVDDVVALAQPILRHRMALTFAARADGVTMSDVIGRLTRPFL
jgi:MoxR-like ATPase